MISLKMHYIVIHILQLGPMLIFLSTADTFRLAAYYSDHMVLQMAPGRAVVWGYGDVGAQITVLFKDTKYTAVAATSKSLLGP